MVLIIFSSLPLYGVADCGVESDYIDRTTKDELHIEIVLFSSLCLRISNGETITGRGEANF